MEPKEDTSLIVVPESAIIIVRSDKEIAQAIMQAGPDFGKIQKQHFRDHFTIRNSK